MMTIAHMMLVSKVLSLLKRQITSELCLNLTSYDIGCTNE